MNKSDTGFNRFTGEDLSAQQMKKIVELGSAGSPKSYMFSAAELQEFCKKLLERQRKLCAKGYADTAIVGTSRNERCDVILNAPEPEL